MTPFEYMLKIIFLTFPGFFYSTILDLVFFSVGCVIPLDRPRFPFNDMEISMVDICILDVLIISILELISAE